MKYNIGFATISQQSCFLPQTSFLALIFRSHPLVARLNRKCGIITAYIEAWLAANSARLERREASTSQVVFDWASRCSASFVSSRRGEPASVAVQSHNIRPPLRHSLASRDIYWQAPVVCLPSLHASVLHNSFFGDRESGLNTKMPQGSLHTHSSKLETHSCLL